jgi:phenylpropionate dioxygenase-like ring-hydroxylating dioxygenase large terminal subunit
MPYAANSTSSETTEIEGDVSVRLKRQAAIARDMQQRLMTHAINKTTDRESGPLFNDASAYTDPQILERERKEIFRTLPLLAALSRDIPRPGDKILFDAAGPSIVIVRSKDHTVKAYLNLCPHRASKVVVDCRSSMLMTCPFHAWTFDLDGKLVGLPGSKGFQGIERARLGLIPVPVAEWHGLIFVIARAGDDKIDIDTYLGDLGPELRLFDFANSKPIKRSSLKIKANWKYALDTFGESYHVSVLHPNTVGKVALNDTIIYDGFAPHHRVGFAVLSMLEDAKESPEKWPQRPLSGAYLLFPNTIIHVTAIGPGHTHIFYRLYPGDLPGEAFTMMDTYRSGEIPEDESIEAWQIIHDYQGTVVENEDYNIAQVSQSNLEYAPSGFRVLYGSNEIALQRFHLAVAKLLRRPMA